MDFLYKVEGFIGNEDEKVASLTSYIGKDKEVVIPEEIDGYPVCNIEPACFLSNSDITKITFIRFCILKHSAIVDCPNLKEVILGSENIIKGRFIADCNNILLTLSSFTEYNNFLKYYNIDPEEISLNINFDLGTLIDTSPVDSESVRLEAFVFPENKNIIIPNEINGKKIKRINPIIFDASNDIESIRFNEYITEIPDYFGNGCFELKAIYNLEHIKKIGEYAFCNCRKLKVDFNELKKKSFIGKKVFSKAIIENLD